MKAINRELDCPPPTIDLLISVSLLSAKLVHKSLLFFRFISHYKHTYLSYSIDKPRTL
jgi:hypothetical protein